MSSLEDLIVQDIERAIAQNEKLTLSACAKRLTIPRSTIVYRIQKLGYENWNSFKFSFLDKHRKENTPQSDVEAVLHKIKEIIDLSKVKTIVVGALGDAQIAGSLTVGLLNEAGYSASNLSDISLTQSQLKRIGVLIVCNESGSALFPSCLEAYSAHIPIIALTASHDTPVSKIATVNIIIKNNKSEPLAYEPNYFAVGCIGFLKVVVTKLKGMF